MNIAIQQDSRFSSNIETEIVVYTLSNVVLINIVGYWSGFVHCCKSAKENDLQDEKSFPGEDSKKDAAEELHPSTCFLLLLPELLMATARANLVFRFEVVTLFDMPLPPLLLRHGGRFFSHVRP